MLDDRVFVGIDSWEFVEMSVDPSKIPVVKSPHSIVIAAHSVIPQQYLILDIVPILSALHEFFKTKN